MIDEHKVRILRASGMLAATDPERRTRILEDALQGVDEDDRAAALAIMTGAEEIIRLVMASTPLAPPR